MKMIVRGAGIIEFNESCTIKDLWLLLFEVPRHPVVPPFPPTQPATTPNKTLRILHLIHIYTYAYIKNKNKWARAAIRTRGLSQIKCLGCGPKRESYH